MTNIPQDHAAVTFCMSYVCSIRSPSLVWWGPARVADFTLLFKESFFFFSLTSSVGLVSGVSSLAGLAEQRHSPWQHFLSTGRVMSGKALSICVAEFAALLCSDSDWQVAYQSNSAGWQDSSKLHHNVLGWLLIMTKADSPSYCPLTTCDSISCLISSFVCQHLPYFYLNRKKTPALRAPAMLWQLFTFTVNKTAWSLDSGDRRRACKTIRHLPPINPSNPLPFVDKEFLSCVHSRVAATSVHTYLWSVSLPLTTSVSAQTCDGDERWQRALYLWFMLHLESL